MVPRAGVYGSQTRDDYNADDVEQYFNYMGMLATEVSRFMQQREQWMMVCRCNLHVGVGARARTTGWKPC